MVTVRKDRVRPLMQAIIIRLAEIVVDPAESPNKREFATHHLRGALRNRHDNGLTCPHCDGEGEEPGAPVDLEDGTALCLVCKGKRRVSLLKAYDYFMEE